MDNINLPNDTAASKNRPVNLGVLTMKFPIMAIVSILHRISGILLFLLLPVMMYFLQVSLNEATGFAQMQQILMHPFTKLLVWGFGAALIYHLIAGIRHILMDMGYGEELSSGRNGAYAVILLSMILAVLFGIWLW